MEVKEIKYMRKRQIVVSNILMVTGLSFFFSLAKIFAVSFAHFYLVIAVLILIQTIYRIVRNDSTKSLIPIFEKVAVYEKQKLGAEWYKQRKTNHVASIILFCVILINALLSWNSPTNISEIDTLFIFFICLFFIIMMNMIMITNINKVDRSTSEQELKGYTWKTSLIGVVIGVVSLFVIFVFSIIYGIATS